MLRLFWSHVAFSLSHDSLAGSFYPRRTFANWGLCHCVSLEGGIIAPGGEPPAMLRESPRQRLSYVTGTLP